MSRITLAQASKLIDAALAKGKALGLKPLTVAVVDAGGHLIACQRQDGASFGRPQLAQGKAAAALTLGVSSRAVGEMASERPWFITSLAASAVHPLIPAAGGVIVLDDQGMLAGAIGVTGDTSDNDEICALAGIAATGLRAQ